MKTNENKAQIIGAQIKIARDEAGYSQLDLAKELNFESATAISLIESGDRNITVENLEKIADFLHRDIKFFLGKDEQKELNVEYALRADPNLSDDAKKAILQFVDLAKNRKNER